MGLKVKDDDGQNGSQTWLFFCHSSVRYLNSKFQDLSVEILTRLSESEFVFVNPSRNIDEPGLGPTGLYEHSSVTPVLFHRVLINQSALMFPNDFQSLSPGL